MGRKTQATTTTEKLNEATAEAARILSLNLAACSKAMQDYLDFAGDEEGWDERETFIQRAIELANTTAKLGDTIGRLNGETRQHISVERNSGSVESAPKSTEIAPQNAPNNIARGGEKAVDSLEKSPALAAKPGGGG